MHRYTTSNVEAVTADRPRVIPYKPERRWAPMVVMLVALIVLADALIGEQGFASGRRARKVFEAVGAEVTALRDQNARLRDEVRRLRDDPAEIEFVARQDLGLARPGEILVVLK